MFCNAPSDTGKPPIVEVTSGIEEITSPQDIEAYDYVAGATDPDTERERAYFNGSEGNGGG